MTIKLNNLEEFLNNDDQEYTRDIPDLFNASPTVRCDECGEEFDPEEPCYQINPENPDPIANHMMGFINDQSDWKEGDGGETALFDEGRNIPLSDYIMKTNPVPNRLFVYEINPFSFHSFLSNKKFERTTIMMWYHTSAEDTNKRYGWYGEDFYKGVTDSDLQLMKKQWKGNDIKDLDTFSSMHYYCKHADRHIDLHQNVEHPYDHYCPENTNGKKRIK